MLDHLALLTDTAVNVACVIEPDWDWVMDCQDYHDLELLLDATGNLDAPV